MTSVRHIGATSDQMKADAVCGDQDGLGYGIHGQDELGDDHQFVAARDVLPRVEGEAKAVPTYVFDGSEAVYENIGHAEGVDHLRLHRFGHVHFPHRGNMNPSDTSAASRHDGSMTYHGFRPVDAGAAIFGTSDQSEGAAA